MKHDTMKYSLYLTATLFLVSLTTAAPQTNPQGDPGFFGASHPLHQAEVVTDNLAVSFGLSNSSDIAKERLAEANQAAMRGKVNAQERVMNQYNKIAENARNLQADGEVQSLLEQIQNSTPEDADQGLQNALNQAENLTQQNDVEIPETAEKAGNQVSDTIGDLGKRTQGLVK